MKQQTQNQYNKMVSGFRRSLSFPTPRSLSFPIPRSPLSTWSSKSSAAEKSGRHHLRSTSLPCRFHPLVSQLDDDIRSLRAWQFEPAGSPAWIVDGLARLDHLHASLDDLLHLSLAQDPLRHSRTNGALAGWTERLLDDSLRLADAHGTFRSAVVALRQHHSATQAAIRRRDESRLASCVRAQRQAEKELSRLASAVREVERSPDTADSALASHDASEAELAGIFREVTMVTATASAAVFSGIAAASSAALAPASRGSRYCMVGPLLSKRYGKEAEEEGEKQRQSTFQRLEALEECMVALEEKSERVFRSLINTRVSLLNILTPSL